MQTPFTLMAEYNQWMNARLYAACERLDLDTLHADQGAFFGSIFATLGHILRADTIWLKRFAEHPANFSALAPLRPTPHPYDLPDMPWQTWDELSGARTTMDDVIVDFCADISDADLAQVLSCRNRTGEVFAYAFAHLLQHFFNHQTHHRGQVTTLLSQDGIDVGVTDLAAILPPASSSQGVRRDRRIPRSGC